MSRATRAHQTAGSRLCQSTLAFDSSIAGPSISGGYNFNFLDGDVTYATNQAPVGELVRVLCVVVREAAVLTHMKYTYSSQYLPASVPFPEFRFGIAEMSPMIGGRGSLIHQAPTFDYLQPFASGSATPTDFSSNTFGVGNFLEPLFAGTEQAFVSHVSLRRSRAGGYQSYKSRAPAAPVSSPILATLSAFWRWN